MIVQRNVNTKQDEDSDAKTTLLKVEFPDGTLPWLAEGFMAFLVVKLQGNWRKKGIPSKFDCRAIDYAPGSRATVTPEQALAMLSPEERRALLEKYRAELDSDAE